MQKEFRLFSVPTLQRFEDRTQHIARGENIGRLLIAFNFTFNGDAAVIAERMEPLQQRGKIHLSLPHRRFKSEIMSVGRITAILAMNPADIFSDYVKRIHGIGLAVQDQIGGVEIDSKVGQSHVLKQTQQGDGCLLPGFEQQILAVCLQMRGHTPHRGHEPGIKRIVISALPEIVSSAGEIISSLIQGIIKALPKLLQNAPKIINTIIDGIKGFIFKIGDIGKDIIEGLWEGIKSMGDWLWDKISGFFGGVWDGICGFFGISSPSKEMAWVGEMLNRGLAEGIENTEFLSVRAAEQMGEAVTDAVSGINGNVAVGAQLSDHLRSVYDAVTTRTPTTETVAYRAAAGMVNGMQTAMQTSASPVRLEIPLVIDGLEFSRAIIPDLREVMRANPEVAVRI